MKKAICIALIFGIIIMIFCGTLAQESNAFAATAVVIGAVIAIMAASGITLVATSGLTANELKQYVGDKLDEWAADMGQPLEHLINSAGIGMTISGLLTVGTAAASGINSFISWLVNDEGLQNNQTVAVMQGGLSLCGYAVIACPCNFQWTNASGQPRNLEVRESGVAVWLRSSANGANAVQIISLTPGVQVSGYLYYGGNAVYPYSTTILQNGYYWCEPGPEIGVIGSSIPLEYCNHPNLGSVLGNGAFETTGGLAISSGTISIPTVGQDEKYFIDVTGVLPGDTVADATDQIIDNVISGVQSVQDVVVDESEPEYEITGPVAISGLAQVFPFCIPFDIYNFLAALAADPEAPCFEWRFYVPGICDETLEIDLSVFNTVAQILRTMELLAFIVGLAFVTRSRFIRS